MLKIFPKYLDFENISKKCIRVPGPLRYYIIDVMKQCCFYVAKFKIRKLKISRIFICTLTEKREYFFLKGQMQ